jgi:ankyrin repeat protein
VSSGVWKISRLYIELGADINLETSDGPIFQAVVNPQSPYPPIELLASVLDRGADPNAVTEDSHPALEWPVFTSNVLAVHELLLRGAEPVLSEEYNYCKSAEEILNERMNQCPVNVVGEDGQVIEESWTSAVAASKLVVNIMSIARN